MKKECGADGTTPLSFEEYQGMRGLFGMVSLADSVTKRLEGRMKLTPVVWRDARLIQTLLGKMLPIILSTVPAKKLIAMRAELSRTEVEVKMRAAAPMSDESMLVMVPQGALEYVTREAAGFRCTGCELQAFWECPMYQAMEQLYHYDFSKRKGCPFAE